MGFSAGTAGQAANLGNLGATETITFPANTTTIVRGTLNADCAISFTGMSAGSSFSLELRQDATGGRRASFSGVTFLGGAGAVTPAANAVDLFTFYSPDGAAIYGVQSTAPSYGQQMPGQSTAALETIPRLMAGSSRTITSGTTILSHFMPDTDRLVSTLTSFCVGTLAATLTVGKMGIATYNGGNSYTTIARTANDTTLWNAVNSFTRDIADDGTNPLASVLLRAGVWYAFELLAVGGTMPQLAGPSNTTSAFMGASSGGQLRRLTSSVTGQTDITAAITASTNFGSFLWGAAW